MWLQCQLSEQRVAEFLGRAERWCARRVAASTGGSVDRNSPAAGLLWWPGQRRLAANFAGVSRCSILEIFGLLLKPFQGLWEQVIPVLDPLPHTDQPCPHPSPDSTPLDFVHVSFILVPENPSPLIPSNLPSSYCQIVLNFKVCGYTLLACLFC